MENSNFNHVREKLKEIIIQDLDVNVENYDLKYDTSLYEDGIGLDSITIVNLIY